jgi:hypothetical protein
MVIPLESKHEGKEGGRFKGVRGWGGRVIPRIPSPSSHHHLFLGWEHGGRGKGYGEIR